MSAAETLMAAADGLADACMGMLDEWDNDDLSTDAVALVAEALERWHSARARHVREAGQVGR